MSEDDSKLSRRRLLGGAAGTAAAASPWCTRWSPTKACTRLPARRTSTRTAARTATWGAVGRVDPRVNGFDPAALVRDFDPGERRREGGRTVREFELVAQDKEIEVAPGREVRRLDLQRPRPRARPCAPPKATGSGSTSSTARRHPHTIHFHGIHSRRHGRRARASAAATWSRASTFTYEFDAEPFGLHLYHCHSMPLADHIAKGLYGAFIIDPKEARAPADELVMVMNGFDTNFDRENEIYAVNTVAFAYHDQPDPGEARRAGADLPREHPRVRPDQLVPPPRQLLRLLPDRHQAASRATSPTP